jgi:predicted hotdog family 3-hydroxylacyl-ACP dehydratase
VTTTYATYPPIIELVPHRPPMLLLDRVLSYDGECVVCETVLGPQSPFAEQGEVPAVVGIEYMAQAIAAGAGLSAREKGDDAGKMGFLLGCRSLSIAVDSFQVGDRLTIEARRTWGENQIGSFACKVQRGAEVLVEGALTVYQGPLPEEMTR